MKLCKYFSTAFNLAENSEGKSWIQQRKKDHLVILNMSLERTQISVFETQKLISLISLAFSTVYEKISSINREIHLTWSQHETGQRLNNKLEIFFTWIIRMRFYHFETSFLLFCKSMVVIQFLSIFNVINLYVYAFKI